MQFKTITQRAQFLYIGILVGFVLLAGRLVYLQIFRYPEMKAYAAKQQQKPVRIAAKRGVITDRNGHKLAIDIEVYSIYVDPEFLLIPPQQAADKLAPILGEKPEDLLKILQSKSWRYLKRKVDEPVMKQVKALGLKGIGTISESKRIYPHNTLGASLLGYTDIDNQGQEGIEKSFDEYLKGGSQRVNIITDAYGNEILRQDGNLPLLTEKAKANKVILTIDENLQYIAERELAKAVQDMKADRGTILIMDTKNGDLLSLATFPSFDPNSVPTKGWSPHIKNWAVTDFYEPGSTMKIFSIAAALEAGKVTVDEKVECPGLIRVENWAVHDHHQSATSVRYLTPLEIIQVSSNVGTSKIARRMPPQQHRDLLEKFGFGRATHSGLNGEVQGILPELPWRPSRQSTVAFGQGVAVTPLQIVTAASALANKGIRVEPRIIQKIMTPDGEVIKQFDPVTNRTLSEETARQMMEMMTEVVEGEKGTAHAAKIKGYRMAGKTGTADKVVNGRYNGEVMSSFVGILPADDPKYIIFVLLDSPKTAHYASMTAVPVFREVAQHIITYYGMQPTRHNEIKDIAEQAEENKAREKAPAGD